MDYFRNLVKIDMCSLEVNEASIVHAQVWPGLCHMNSGKLNSCVLPFEELRVPTVHQNSTADSWETV